MKDDEDEIGGSGYAPRATAGSLANGGRSAASVLDLAAQCTGLLDREGRWIWASPELERLLQRNIDEGDPLLPPDAPADLIEVREAVDVAAESPGVPIAVNARVHLSEDAHFYVEGTLVDFTHVPSVNAQLLSIVDVTDRLAAHDAAQTAAAVDPLTGLSNRLALDRRLQDTVARAERRNESFAVLFLDLDGFKRVNDEHGHDVGDAVLLVIAERLVGRLRGEDIIARVGGDEFVIVTGTAADLDEPHVSTLCESILTEVSRPVHVHERELEVGVSIGVVIDDGLRNPGELVRDADMAMYEAKRNGSSGYAFHNREVTRTAVARRRMRSRVADAVASGSVVVHFQPIIDAVNGEVVAYEALARVSVDDDLLLPADFLAAVSAAGVNADLGRHVLQRALEAARMWEENVSVSVNAELSTITRADFADTITAELTRRRVAPSRLVLEIEDDVLHSPRPDVVRVLTRLRRLGVRFAVVKRELGIGFLDVLESPLISWVKLDPDIIHQARDADAGELLASTADFAESRGLWVVAERVEDDATRRWLRNYGVRYLQGFLLGRPGPFVDIDLDDDPAPVVLSSVDADE